MSKLYFEAMKKLPKKFIDDGTRAIELLNGRVFIANNKYPVMIYDREQRKFIKYVIQPDPFYRENAFIK